MAVVVVSTAGWVDSAAEVLVGFVVDGAEFAAEVSVAFVVDGAGSAADSAAAGMALAGTAGDGAGAVSGPITAQDGDGADPGPITVQDWDGVILTGIIRTRILPHTHTLTLIPIPTLIRIQPIPRGMLRGMLRVPLFIAEQSRPPVCNPMEARFI